MERKLQERMVGAGVLILALVILGPLVLDGSSDRTVEEEAAPGQRSDELRTHTFRLSPSAASTPETVTAAPGAAPAAQVEPSSSSPQPAMAPRKPGLPAVAAGSKPQAPAQETPVETPARIAAPPAQPAPQTAPKAELAPAATVPGGWLVQVGTFGQKDNAERLVKSLNSGGFAAFLSPTTRGGKTMYRVRVGPAGSRETAAGVASRLASSGQSGQVVAQ